MRLPVIASMCALLIVSCSRSRQASPAPTPLPAVSIEVVPAPASAEVTIQRGSNLREIAGQAYGHERFSGFVATQNGIADPERVSAGTVLRTPSLAVCFRDAGLAPDYQPAINCLAKACTDYYAVEGLYLRARKASGVASGTFAIPPDIRSTFESCAAMIDAALPLLRSARSPHTVPTMTIGQFQQAAFQIRELATGSIDGYGYDYDLVGQRLGLAFTNALIWTKRQHQ
jgi:hypothetical protein